MNRDPSKARLSKAQKSSKARQAIRDSGDLESLRVALWQAIERCRQAIEQSPEVDQEVRSTINSMVCAANSYIKLVEACDLDARVRALEESAT